jgi:hypothetical protein
MSVINKNKISLGVGNIEFGEYTDDVFGVFEDVGAVKARVNINIEREVLDFETGRPLVTIIQEVIRERVTFSATLAELNMATLKMALGQGVVGSGSIPTFLDGTSTALRGTLQAGKTSVLSGTLLKFGGLPSHAFIGLRFTHSMASGKRNIFEGYRASPTGRLALPFNETDWNIYDVEFRLLADTCRPAGEQYFQLFQEAVAAIPPCP